MSQQIVVKLSLRSELARWRVRSKTAVTRKPLATLASDMPTNNDSVLVVAQDHSESALHFVKHVLLRQEQEKEDVPTYKERWMTLMKKVNGLCWFGS